MNSQEQPLTVSQSTKEIDETYKNSITQFLQDYSVYDCLPKNSLIVVIDRNFSCYEAIDLIVSNDYEECTVWNSDFAKFDGLITHSDIIKMVLAFFENTVQNKQSLNKRYAKVNIENQLNTIDEQMDNYDEEKKFENEFKEEQQQIKEEQQQQEIQLEKQFENLSTDFNESSQQTMISELSKFQIRDWFRYISKGQSDCIELKSVNLNATLQDACLAMRANQINRIFVTDNDTQLIVGIINNHDILILLLRNLTQDIPEGEKNLPSEESSAQVSSPQQNLCENQNKDQISLEKQPINVYQESNYDLPITYLLQNQAKFFQHPECINQQVQTYDVFWQMIYKYKASSLPIEDDRGKFLGLVYRRDIIYIWKEKNFNILSKPVSEFLKFIVEQKKKYKISSIDIDIKFTPSDSIKNIVQRCVFVPDNRLIQIDESTGKLVTTISLTDILNYYISNEKVGN